MANSTTQFEDVLAQAQRLTPFQKIRLMERLAASVQRELREFEWQEWHDFIDQTAGSLADTPVERPAQGDYEKREPIE